MVSYSISHPEYFLGIVDHEFLALICLPDLELLLVQRVQLHQLWWHRHGVAWIKNVSECSIVHTFEFITFCAKKRLTHERLVQDFKRRKWCKNIWYIRNSLHKRYVLGLKNSIQLIINIKNNKINPIDFIRKAEHSREKRQSQRLTNRNKLMDTLVKGPIFPFFLKESGQDEMQQKRGPYRYEVEKKREHLCNTLRTKWERKKMRNKGMEMERENRTRAVSGLWNCPFSFIVPVAPTGNIGKYLNWDFYPVSLKNNVSDKNHTIKNAHAWNHISNN